MPEIIVPAGFNDVSYEPSFVLSDDKKSYVQRAGTVQSKLTVPLPISIQYWAGPGDEPVMLKVASAYESATHHRKPPAAFPALKEKTNLLSGSGASVTAPASLTAR